MSQQDKTKLLLESSEERRRKHVGKALKKPEMKKALYRDQRVKRDDALKFSQAACNAANALCALASAKTIK